MKTSKREYNKAVKIVKAYEAEQAAILKKKREKGYYSVMYLLERDGDEDFRERLIKASSPEKAIERFMKQAPVTLCWIDKDLEMNGESYYIGNHPAILNYL